MDIKLHNTLSKKMETFVPLKAGEVRMYNCGPTVYDYAHIGNLRSFVMADSLRRVFEYNGYTVKQVMNITDVGHLSGDNDFGEDKMSKALKREGKPFTLQAMVEIGSYYANAFQEDLKALNIETPHELPRASEHIKEDIEVINALEQKGIAYKISSGMYFDISKFPKYGALGQISLEGQIEGARVAVQEEKKNARDFCLWKFDENLGWESPWGKGFPGWHIECSAMSRKYLGQPFDVHTGGIDLIPIHHNNEIAQSEAAFDEPLATYWVHSAFLDINNAKMAKSAGTSLVLETLRNMGISPIGYRYWLLTAKYSSPVNFNEEAVKSAQTALIRLLSIYRDLPDDENARVSSEYEEKFRTFVNDDLNTPKAIALVWDMIKDNNVSDIDKKATLNKFDEVFGFNISSLPAQSQENTPQEILALAEAREQARASKDWEKADALRKEIEDRGYSVEDSKEGIKIVRND